MVGFGSILDTGQVEDHKMMKDKLIDGKELQVGLKVNQSRCLKKLVVNLMNIQFRLKLDKFYCIGVYELTEKGFLLTQQINV